MSCLCVAPSAVIFGLITWRYSELWYVQVVIHSLGFIGALVLFLLPDEKKWRFIKALARMGIDSRNPQPENYEIIDKLEELERKEKESTRDSGV